MGELLENGDLITNCIKCGMLFDDGDEMRIGKLQYCNEEEGGCGQRFKIIIPAKSITKKSEGE